MDKEVSQCIYTNPGLSYIYTTKCGQNLEGQSIWSKVLGLPGLKCRPTSQASVHQGALIDRAQSTKVPWLTGVSPPKVPWLTGLSPPRCPGWQASVHQGALIDKPQAAKVPWWAGLRQPRCPDWQASVSQCALIGRPQLAKVSWLGGLEECARVSKVSWLAGLCSSKLYYKQIPILWLSKCIEDMPVPCMVQ